MIGSSAIFKSPFSVKHCFSNPFWYNGLVRAPSEFIFLRDKGQSLVHSNNQVSVLCSPHSSLSKCGENPLILIAYNNLGMFHNVVMLNIS